MNDLRSSRDASCETTPRDRANGRRILYWSIGWAIAVLAAPLARGVDLEGGRSLAILTAILSTAMGLGTVAAYVRFLRETDELQQRIQLEALALAFGVAIVLGMGGTQIARALDLAEPGFSVIMAGMLFVYCFGVIFGRRRYQ